MCDFCYNVWTETDQPAKKQLSLKEIVLLAKSLTENPKVAGVTLTGGEPLLRDDICGIAGIFRKAGVKVAIATNGTLLTKEKARELAYAGVEHFDIGFTSPSHETVMAVTRAVRTKCTVTASICIHRNNFRMTGVRIRTACALGADSICLNRFVPTGRGRANQSSMTLSDDDLLSSLELAQQASEKCPIHIYTGIPVGPGIATPQDFPAIQFSTCRCGDTKWAIDPSGNLRTCEQNSRTFGNLLEMSFDEAVKRHSVEIREFRKTAGEGCRFLL